MGHSARRALTVDFPPLARTLTTLEEIRAALASRSIHVGHGTVWRFFAAEGVSFKKNRARQRARAA
jgi:transposase